MKTLKRIIVLTAVVAVFGLSTSCTEDNLEQDEVLVDNELQSIDKKEITEGAI